ncbi:MAG TPA: hypothetical protein VH518_08510, partial [Tepidisphaeraceae bacterium]
MKPIGWFCAVLTLPLGLARAESPSVTPLPNVTFFQVNNPNDFKSGIDAAVQREGAGPSLILSSTTAKPFAPGLATRGADPAPFRGHRVRFSAYVKTKDVANRAGLWLIAYGPDGRILTNDDMNNRSVTGSTDWQKMEIVTEVPQTCATLLLAPSLMGRGQMWMDSAQLEIVGDDVPMTDDRPWHLWSTNFPVSKLAPDPNVQRNGHPTLCMSVDKSAPAGSWAWYGQCDRTPEKYLGHRLRISMWIKAEGVAGASGPNIRPKGPNFQLLTSDEQTKNRPIRGTSDWKRCETVCEIPADTQCIDSGVVISGRGKLWIDDIQYELLETAPTA